MSRLMLFFCWVPSPPSRKEPEASILLWILFSSRTLVKGSGSFIPVLSFIPFLLSLFLFVPETVKGRSRGQGQEEKQRHGHRHTRGRTGQGPFIPHRRNSSRSSTNVLASASRARSGLPYSSSRKVEKCMPCCSPNRRMHRRADDHRSPCGFWMSTSPAF